MEPEQSSAVKPLNKRSQVGRLWLYPTVTYTAPTVDASWPTSSPAYFYVFICCAFHSQQLHSSSSWHVPSSSSLHRAKRHAIWAKPTFLDAQICLHYCGNSSQTANMPLLTTHTHTRTHKSTDSTENRQKKEQINLSQPAVCAFMCSTLFDCNPQKHETVCEPQEARKKKSTQISCLRNIWEQKQSNFTHQSETTQTGRDRKLL